LINRKHGFTLIELIVTIAIMSIIGGIVSQLFTSTYKINNFVNDNSDYQTTSQIIMQKIQNELKYANSITIDVNSPTTINADKKYIYVSGGNPVKNEGSSLSDAVSIASLQTGLSANLTFKKNSIKSVEITVDLLKNGVKVYTLDTVIIANNLITSTVSGSEGQAIEYTLPIAAASPVLIDSISVASLNDVINTDKGTLQMNADILPADATNKSVIWSVIKDTGDASIDSFGLLTAVSNGTVTVKAAANDGSGKSGTKTITISNQAQKLITGITLTTANGEASVKKNKTLQIISSILPADAANKTIVWSVSNTNMTIVNGLLNPSGTTGTVTITAAASDGSGVKGTITISVTNN